MQLVPRSGDYWNLAGWKRVSMVKVERQRVLWLSLPWRHIPGSPWLWISEGCKLKGEKEVIVSLGRRRGCLSG
jgi:hypothetical protein